MLPVGAGCDCAWAAPPDRAAAARTAAGTAAEMAVRIGRAWNKSLLLLCAGLLGGDTGRQAVRGADDKSGKVFLVLPWCGRCAISARPRAFFARFRGLSG